MKSGGGKRKGSKFERQVCVALSLLITNGKMKDVFWRSSMSGGRATIHVRKGGINRQAGDITAVAPEGHAFTDMWYVECKNVKSTELESFLLSNAGPLAKFWRVAKEQAHAHKREPMLIIRARGPALVITEVEQLEGYTSPQLTSHARCCDISFFSDMLHEVPAAVAAMRKGKK